MGVDYWQRYNHKQMLVGNLRFEPVIDRLKHVSIWAILLGSLIGCRASIISIGQISEKQIGKTVYLTGRVVHLAPLIDHAAYKIEDTRGRIWVVTPRKLPKLGQQINIKGKIEYQSLPFAQQELGDFYVVELEQLESSINDNR